jgi:hypothetical protein
MAHGASGVAPWVTEARNQIAGLQVGATDSFMGMAAANERAMEMMQEHTTETTSFMQNAFSGWAVSFSSELNDMLWEGDITFSAIAESFGKMITQMLIQSSMTDITGALFSGSTGGGIFSSIAGFFGGGKASGGPVYPGSTYLVGEKGPELLHMGTAGMVTPNDKIGGNVQVTINNAPESTTVREETISGLRHIIVDIVGKEANRNQAFRSSLRSAVR